MNLIDIVKRLPWPDGAAVVVQDCTVDGTGILKYCKNDRVTQVIFLDEERSERWATAEAPLHFEASEIADDHDEAIITRADWLAAQEQVEPKGRELGFYWARILSSGEWVVCWWNGYCFDSTHDQEFGPGEVEVDERRIVRQP